MLMDLQVRFYIHLGFVCLLPILLIILITWLSFKVAKGEAALKKNIILLSLIMLISIYVVTQWTIPHVQDFKLIQNNQPEILHGTIDDYSVRKMRRRVDRMGWFTIDGHTIHDNLSPKYFNFQNRSQNYKITYLPNSDKVYEVEWIGGNDL